MSTYTYDRRHTQHASTPESSEVKQDPREELKEQTIKSLHLWRGRAHKEDPMSSIEQTFRDEYSAADLLGDQKIFGMLRSGPGLVGARGKPVEHDRIYSIGARDEDSEEAAQAKKKRGKGLAKEITQRSDMSDSYVPYDENKKKLYKFEEIAFNRGKLSASVLKGTSEMMLFSCLKRTFRIGDGEPEHEHKIFEGRERPEKGGNRNPGRDFGTSLAYNKTYPRSAVALTVQVNRSAMDTVNQLADVVDREKEGSFALWKSMPFLSYKREEKVLKRYKKCLEYLESKDGKRGKTGAAETNREGEVAALERAITYLELVIQRKVHARLAFARKLKDVAWQAEVASKIFSSDGLLKAMEEGLEKGKSFQPMAAGDPPDDKDNPFNGALGNSNEEVASDKSSGKVSKSEQESEEKTAAKDVDVADRSGS